MRVNPQVFSEAVLDLDLPELYPGDCPLFLTSYIPPPKITEALSLRVPSISPVLFMYGVIVGGFCS